MNNDLIDIFYQMVKIDSESGEEEEFILFLKELFTKELDCKYIIDNYGNLIIKIPGKNTNCREPVLFGVHADTVKPGKGIEPVLREGVIYSKGNTILGADDKAAIAELYEAVRTADVYPPLEIAVVREEEVGLLGSKNIDRSLFESKIGFVIDTRKLEDIVVGGPSIMKIDITITGKAAHSGMEPEKGISSIKVASQAISILKEGWIDEETTVNVGTIQGGEAINSVPEKTIVTIECRSKSHNKCITQSDKIRELFINIANLIKAKVLVDTNLSVKAYNIPENSRVVKIAKKMVRSIGLEPNVKILFGGSDASNYNSMGIETVVIGKGGEASHTTEENITVVDMEKAVKMLQVLFKELR